MFFFVAFLRDVFFFGEFDFMTDDDSGNKALDSDNSSNLTCRNKTRIFF